MAQTITPFLWFDTEAEDVARYHTALFPNSRIVTVTHYGDAGPRPAGMVMTVEYELDGQRFVALNGGPGVHFDHSVSFVINCRDQDDVDRYWEALADGGEEGPCGWVKDRFGVQWQVVPDELPALLSDPDPDRAQRAMAAMLSMRKLDLPAMRAAADGAVAQDVGSEA